MLPFPIKLPIGPAIALAVLLCGAERAVAQALWQEGFEGPGTTWKDAGGDAHYKLQYHERAQVGAHFGGWCERLQVVGTNGSCVYLSHDIQEARVISELAITVWVKADRPGLQVLARVVLPRVPNPRDGGPTTTLVSGSGYTQSGAWQQLRIDNLPLLLERQARVLRAQLGSDVDAREAYVDQVVLNVYGGPGVTNLSIDDLEVTGLIGVPRESSTSTGQSPATSGNVERLPAPSTTLISSDVTRSFPRAPGSSRTASPMDQRPGFPRMIEYRGESLARLRSMGFSIVRLTEPPTAQVLDEAARLGMLLVCPPPSSQELEIGRGRSTSALIGAEYDPVWAWDLGSGLSARELAGNRQWARAIQAADTRSRPLVCEPDSDLRAYSRQMDLLIADRSPLGSSLELPEYAAWLRGRVQLARPGTPFWATVETQPAPRLYEQVTLFTRPTGGRPVPLRLQDEQIRLCTYTAFAAGIRGIIFKSHSPLDAEDPETQHRAALLELLNLELDLVEPWLAQGSVLTVVPSTDPHLVGVVLQLDRAKIVLPLPAHPRSQFVTGSTTVTPLSFVIPGAADASDAYELTLSGIRPLVHKRVAGGVRVALTESDQLAMILLTQDPLVLDNFSRKLAKIRQRAAELQRRLAIDHLLIVEDVDRQLAAQGRPLPQARGGLTTARASLAQCDTAIAASDFPTALTQARRATQSLNQVERAHWEVAAGQAPPLTTALSAGFATLPEHWRLVNQLAAGQRGPNLIGGGDFEDLRGLMQAGWRHFQHPQTGIVTSVELSPENPQGGRFALRLRALPESAPSESAARSSSAASATPAVVETPPLWITSPAIVVEAGQLVQFRGWVHVPKAIAGSVDGLLVLESLGGEALAERFPDTNGWTEFNLYRIAPRSGPVSITFALCGLGEAWIDNASIQVVERLASSEAHRVQPFAQSPATARPAVPLSRR